MATKHLLVPEATYLALKEAAKKPTAENVVTSSEIRIVKDTPEVENYHTDIVEQLPKRFRTRGKRILTLLKKHPLITIDRDGQLLLNNKVVEGGYVVDFIIDVLSSLPKKTDLMNAKDFVKALIVARVPRNLIINPKRKRDYRKLIKAYPNLK